MRVNPTQAGVAALQVASHWSVVALLLDVVKGLLGFGSVLFEYGLQRGETIKNTAAKSNSRS